MKSISQQGFAKLPLIISLTLLLVGGWFLLDLADAQARDTIRKHHLEDIEQSLYFARRLKGTYPPYDQPTWCGTLYSNQDSTTHQEIEATLRAQNEKYANPLKPFPADPDQQNLDNDHGYFYWKRSPSSFELFAKLEADTNGDRSTTGCSNEKTIKKYDYGIASIWRENL